MNHGTQDELLRLQPAGHFDYAVAASLMEEVRDAEAGAELDLSEVKSIDVPALQFLLALVESNRRRNVPIVVIDSEAGVLRRMLEDIGLRPQQGGLAGRIKLDADEPGEAEG